MTVARSARGTPLVYVSESPEQRMVVVTFGADESNLAGAPGFPVLIGNALDWLTHPSRDAGPAGVGHRPRLMSFEQGVAKVIGPDNVEVPLARVNRTTVGMLRAPGLLRGRRGRRAQHARHQRRRSSALEPDAASDPGNRPVADGCRGIVGPALVVLLRPRRLRARHRRMVDVAAADHGVSAVSLTWTSPAFLWLLAALPLVWAAQYIARTNFNRRQRALQTAVRTLLLAAIAFALARPVLSTSSSRQSIVYVVDVSHSIATAAVDAAAAKIDELNNAIKPAHSRIVAFGRTVSSVIDDRGASQAGRDWRQSIGRAARSTVAAPTWRRRCWRRAARSRRSTCPGWCCSPTDARPLATPERRSRGWQRTTCRLPSSHCRRARSAIPGLTGSICHRA